jgi:uncharacterized protein
MQPSMFNVQVPLAERNEVFLMNTLSDAQVLVSPDVPRLLERIGRGEGAFNDDERATIETLADNGFVVSSREDERLSVREYFDNMRDDTDHMRVTVVTTLQCNFACDYCIQGDHGDHNLHANKMSLDTAQQLVDWIGRQLDAVRPIDLTLTFFGGEPLLNLPVIYFLAERGYEACQQRGVQLKLNMITNGLLLSPEIVDRLVPYGLNGIKITLDGDRDTHNRMRPLRGRQGTFDRIINNVRRIADKGVAITIGGNFDESSVDSYPALLDFLKEQEFADKITKINFKPIIKVEPNTMKGVIPLTVVGGSGKPLNGACMSGTGGSGKKSSSPCDSCDLLDDKLAFLREETTKRGFPTSDGIHMGPCEIHRRNAHGVGVDGGLYACLGFASEPTQAIGHINKPGVPGVASDHFAGLSPLKEECGDCSFIPVCGGGCSVASHADGDMHSPSCHKGAFESGVVSLAHRIAASVS